MKEDASPGLEAQVFQTITCIWNNGKQIDFQISEEWKEASKTPTITGTCKF